MTSFGPYELLEPPLGRGGMGVVYKARHSVLGTHACIKLLLPEYSRNQAIVERFINEARAAARLDGEHVCQVLDCAQAPDGTWYIVLEYLEGVSLSSWLRDKTKHGVEARLRLDDGVGSTDLRQIGRILLPVTGVLHAAHEAGIVHRDVKPANIMLVARWQGGRAHPLHPKVLDFGIAKMRAEHGVNLTRTGTILGTAAYMAPEQLAQAKLADRRADVYALGSVLFQMLTGGYYAWGVGPKNEIAVEQLYHRMVTEPPPDPRARNPVVSPRLAELVRWALTCDPIQRCPSALDFGEALATIIADEGAVTPGDDFLHTWRPAPPVRGPTAATQVAATVSDGEPVWRPPTTAISARVPSAFASGAAAETVDLRPPPPEEDDDAPVPGSMVTPPPVVRTPVYPAPPVASQSSSRGRARMVAGVIAGGVAVTAIVVTLALAGGGGHGGSARAGGASEAREDRGAAIDAGAAPIDASAVSTAPVDAPAVDAPPAAAVDAAPVDAPTDAARDAAPIDKPAHRRRPGAGSSSAIHDFAPPGR